MKTLNVVLGSILAGCMALPLAHGLAMGDATSSASDPDAKQYAEGVKAIRDGHWADAIRIMDQVAQGGSANSAGAIYWKAYALGKQGDTGRVIDTCAALRHQSPESTWIEDCEALEIELHASKGQSVQPKAGQSDELKLLALATLMQKDPDKAKVQIEEVLKGDSSESLREGALFILGRSIPEASYPQVVRISYMEGDVRIARAAKDGGDKNAWEDAVMNLPLSSGDSLVTGKDGRAEIEFEDASTLYVGSDSVLNLEDLHTTSGVPHSELALVSGTATMHLDSLVAGEAFVLHTPTNEILTRYPHRADMRVTSFLDGVGITTTNPSALNLPGGGTRELAAGSTLFYGTDHKLMTTPPEKMQDYAAWDAWVADRFASRQEAMRDVMKEAGLSAPVPGLAEMRGKGSFYKCEYGTCWEPVMAMRGSSLNGPSGVQQPGTSSAAPVAQARPASAFAGSGSVPMSTYVPCLSGALFNYYSYPMMVARMQLTAPGLQYMLNPYDWAICHAGSWMYDNNNNQYAWVAGNRIHHTPPVHWIRFGKTTGFVPVHPKDVKGERPVNWQHGFVPSRNKEGLSVARMPVDSMRPVKVLHEAPRGFRNAPQPVLTRAEAPHMMAYSLRTQNSSKVSMAPRAGVPLRFDARNQTFSTSGHSMPGARSTTVFASGARGGGGFGGPRGGGFSGGAARGGSFGGGARGGNFGGGAGGHMSAGGAGGSGAMHSAGSAPSAPSAGASGGPAPSAGPRN